MVEWRLTLKLHSQVLSGLSRAEKQTAFVRRTWSRQPLLRGVSSVGEQAGIPRGGAKASRQEEQRDGAKEKSRFASLKADKKLHSHPSKERERARKSEHDRRAQRWEAGGESVSASGDWADRYFDEKWVHKQGRLSDWKPSTEEPQSMHRGRASRKFGKRNQEKRPERPLEERAYAREAEPLSKAELEFQSRTGGGATPQQTGFVQEQAERGGLLKFFATCHPGLEEPVAAELGLPSIGAKLVSPGQAGVTFWGPSLETGYRACLWLRSAIRVLVLVKEGPLDVTQAGGDSLYSWTRQAADWPSTLLPGQRFSLEARVRDCTNISSTRLIVTRVRDAICDAVRDARGEKPQPPDAFHPADLPLFAAVYRDRCSLYRDMAGDSLHRRGYKSKMHKASLNESAAAGLLTLAGWPRDDAVLADPMCGSGTLLIEAALMAQGRAPGLQRRHWPFATWPDFDRKAWKKCLAEAKGRETGKATACKLLGSDSHSGALTLAQRDAREAGVSHLISFTHRNCAEWTPAAQPDLVITNPPWGDRLASSKPGVLQSRGEADTASVEASWRELKTFLKNQCPDADAYILTGDATLAHNLSMRTSVRVPLTVGGIECKLLKYKILPPKEYA